MEAMGRLAGGIAHDINNYLANIRGYADLMLRKEMPRDTEVDRLEKIVANVLKAASLLDRLVTFSRRQPRAPEVLDLNEVVESISGMTRGETEERAELELDLATDLWPVRADLAELEQVLVNLYVNAQEAVGPGGWIRVSTRNVEADTERRPHRHAGTTTEWVSCTVSDNGRGIPTELLDRVFEPFFTTKHRTGGSGLGLATVYAIVEDADGRIEIDSEVGVGTEVRVLLPRCRQTLTGALRAAGSGVADLHGDERILLVDDNRELAATVEAFLAALGYQVAVADRPQEALRLAATSEPPFDLVITDVQMTGMEGTELVAELRRQRSIRALFMSGYTERFSLRSGAQRGDAYFLKKPFSIEGLARMARGLLDEPVVDQTGAVDGRAGGSGPES